MGGRGRGLEGGREGLNEYLTTSFKDRLILHELKRFFVNEKKFRE